MSFIRRIRIGKLTGHYQENDKEVIDFIQQVLGKMVMKLSDKYPDKIFYVIVGTSPLDDKVYFEINSNEHVAKAPSQKRKNGYLYCRYEDFWEVLRDKFLLNYNDIQELMKSMMEQHLKQEVGTPSNLYVICKHSLGQHLKQEVGIQD